MNERQSWESFRKGDQQALGDIFTYFYKDLYRYGWKIAPNSDVLDDCIQDLFLDLWQRRHVLPEIESIKGYLFKALKFRLLKSLQRANVMDDLQEASEQIFEISYESLLIERQYEVEQAQKLAEGINQLPPRQQEALYLKYFTQLDYEAISEAMGISKQAVINLNFKSIRFLRDYFTSPLLMGVWLSEFFARVLS